MFRDSMKSGKIMFLNQRTFLWMEQQKSISLILFSCFFFFLTYFECLGGCWCCSDPGWVQTESASRATTYAVKVWKSERVLTNTAVIVFLFLEISISFVIIYFPHDFPTHWVTGVPLTDKIWERRWMWSTLTHEKLSTRGTKTCLREPESARVLAGRSGGDWLKADWPASRRIRPEF